ncbi:MAG: metallophosphoesterase [Candidatus Jettenia sp.]|uniref:Phosphoesterase n=1 Tax=Candidatus Jettenia caeni TaxID=247490 RepID=I3IMH6_9BACT|nr:metallophosphoesterase [Candidatus Jettenia sp. AMX1]MBC6928816.1 metallophosphoesterase [Candidatus Jettenia sp.]NUN24741.1 metallophosphoesterase [Candidatus Jettenia caeni]KAA0250785.1 MAG: metallophosphoesterase [Candidatus Jettenia sp. AMX1]MCE7880128.1 metallophosphoesterase [Candidatus Jettenia sp. AMX1]MCQ3926910.1 metallophosphoesterase [Candidatus Jettenia sp.]
MKIGIIADTHDNIIAIQKAVYFFNTQDLQYVIHAGDYVAPFSLKEFMKVKTKFVGVFGNNDGERKGLLSVCKNIHEPPYDILLGGKHIVVTHMLDCLSKRSKMNTDIIISAHTHIPEIKKENPVYINPGECCGWLHGRSTVAVLDLEVSRAEIIDLSNVSPDIM